MAMAFDFSKMLADPTFQFGAQMLLGSRNPNTTAQAFEGLRQSQQATLANKRAEREAQLEAERQAQLRVYQAAQMENMVAEQQQRAKANEIAEGQLARQQQLADQAAQQDAQRAEMQKRLFDQIGSSGLFGPAGPAAPSAPSLPTIPSTPDAPAAPAPRQRRGGAPARRPLNMPGAGTAGRHGTPAGILDNLAMTESSGNPHAINPQTKALGAYQFLPSTIVAMRKEGITFDPFDAQQSRDAADRYLQSLVKRNGGDMRKALAAYGGFVTKDPTSYIEKVMTGIEPPPASQTGAQAVPSPNRGIDLARTGALAELAGLKGGSSLIDLAKMMKPENVPAGGYVRDPTDGSMRFVGDPYREQQLALQAEGVGLDKWKAANPPHTIVQTDQGPQAFNPNTATTKPVMDSSGKQLRPDELTARSQAQAASVASARMLSTVTSTLKHPGLNPGTGLTGTVMRRIPGTDAYDFNTQIAALKSQQSLEALKELKEAGVSLGQVSNAEGLRLEQQIANLDPNQSPAALKKELTKIAGAIDSMRARTVAGYNRKYPNAEPLPANAAPAAPQLPGGWSVKVK